MNRITLFALALILSLLSTVRAGSPEVNVLLSSAPNPFAQSTSSQVYFGRAAQWVYNYPLIVGNLGNRLEEPGAFELLNLIGPNHYVAQPRDIIATLNFNSWMGVANPGSPFNLEQGHYVIPHVLIKGGGTIEPFSLSQVTYTFDSDDPANWFDNSGGLGGDEYSIYRFGVHFGPDRVEGGGDDTVVMTGPATQLVDKLVVLNLLSGYEIQSSGPNFQGAINTAVSYFTTNSPVNITYKIDLYDQAGNSVIGTSTSTLTIPVPSVLAPVGIAAAGALALRKR